MTRAKTQRVIFHLSAEQMETFVSSVVGATFFFGSSDFSAYLSVITGGMTTGTVASWMLPEECGKICGLRLKPPKWSVEVEGSLKQIQRIAALIAFVVDDFSAQAIGPNRRLTLREIIDAKRISALQ